MEENVKNLLRVLKDVTPELENRSIEELYEEWKKWMREGHKWSLKDYVLEKEYCCN